MAVGKTTPKQKASSTRAKTATKPRSKSAPKTKTTQPSKVTSFRLCRETEKFFSAKITDQTIYWSIFAIFVLVVGLKVLLVSIDTNEVINELANELL